MIERVKSNAVKTCWLIFAILIFVHGFEAIVLRMDETVLGENFINKVFGIVAVFVILRILGWKWNEIGFKKEKIIKNIILGLMLGIASFIISYSVEAIILISQGHDISFGIFTTGFSLTGEAEVHTGIGFILICIFFNIINVIMEEGTFRGLFNIIAGLNHSDKFALLFQAFLFGIWHIVTPLHNLIDGDINTASFIGLSIGYIILAGMMGIKWGLLYRMTGSLYAGMADHFFNNCVATNLLHVTTDTGIDEMMIVRVMIAQLLSFIFILVLWNRKKKNED
jgi:membrane protease YdiL (CAAX protease family)